MQKRLFATWLRTRLVELLHSSANLAVNPVGLTATALMATDRVNS